MKSASWLNAAAFGLLMLAAPLGAAPPNIVLIMADDVGREVLGCYGGQSYRTPRLDRLAEEGMLFEHAYAMPVCHPTRLTLLTGQYPFRWNHPEWGTFPPAAEPLTWAGQLRRAGYATAIAGKWQLGKLQDDPQQPHRMGFDATCLFGWHEGPRYWHPRIWQDGVLRDDVEDRYGPDVYVEFLERFMEEHRAGPFLAFYSMALCHAVTNDLEQPVPFGPQGRYETYREMVEAMDARVGRLQDSLDRLGLRDNTLLLFYSDNGTPRRNIISAVDGQYVHETVVSTIHGRTVPGGKGQLTDLGTRVPLLARWPGVVAPGSRTDALVDTSDFWPTFLELAHHSPEPQHKVDGHSLMSVLSGRGNGTREFVFAENHQLMFVRDRRFKLYSDGRLYDVEQDSDEQHALPDANAARDRLATALRRLVGD